MLARYLRQRQTALGSWRPLLCTGGIALVRPVDRLCLLRTASRRRTAPSASMETLK